ncbi:MAG: shikimate kinase [Acidobacteriota bacterium]|nr:shikimate kinase [Acidobacteriota bacterium]NLH70735.1 shikimate kinase [Brooklawnia sp.]
MAETIVLIGPPAVGKSTVGASLARRLGVPFSDVDQLIEDREQRAISEIFASDGEGGFRAIELDVTLAALDAGGVVALGGGAVTNASLRAALRGHHVIWLRASVQEAVQRVGETTTRPLLVGDVAGSWTRLAQQREPLYAEVATVVVDTDHRTPAQVAHIVLGKLGLQEVK